MRSAAVLKLNHVSVTMRPGNVVAPDELGNAEECGFVAEDTKASVAWHKTL